MGLSFPLLLIFAAVSSLAVISPATTDPSSSIFVLGDSTANCGDNTFMLPLNLSSSSFPICPGSRHRLLPDLIAERMGLGAIPSFYRGNLTASEFPSFAGVNFASSPATILSGGRVFLYQSLGRQVTETAEVIQMLHLDVGPALARHIASTSLFVLSFGNDDYVDLFSRGGSAAVGLKFGRRGLARILVSQVVRAVKGLYNAGARRIVFFGVGPLGCTPRIIWEALGGSNGQSCIEEANEIVSGYNAKLAARLLKLNSELNGTQIVFCDLYKGIMEIISNAQSYGFTNVRDACCGISLFGGMIGCMTQEMACSDPSKHVWWDLYSTTEAVNTMLANWAWSSPEIQFQICNPIALHQLASTP